MAETNRERLKRVAFLGFLAVSIGLIGLIWADGLTGDAPATPGYYRDTFEVDEDIYLTVTAEAIEFRQSLEDGTPPPTPEPRQHDGSGGGQGQGRGQNQESVGTPEPGG